MMFFLKPWRSDRRKINLSKRVDGAGLSGEPAIGIGEQSMKAMRRRFLDRRVYFDGNVIFTEGEKGDAMFLIESGDVRLTRSGGDGDIEIGTVGPHAIFGEMALFDGSPRMATAKSMGETTVLAISPEEFSTRLKRIDDKTRSLILFLIRYCRDTLPYSERQKSGLLSNETKDDSLARRYLDLPQAKNGDVAGEPFISASLRLLVDYTRRRLPPKSGGSMP
jgi:CRP/FNR family cyclic AMP-dependent transcriptional regulator